MIHLLQLLNMLSNEQLDYFDGLFSDLSFELEELGWKDQPNELVNDMLSNHLGLEVESDIQLKMITDTILDERLLRSALNVTRLKRGLL